MNHTKMNEEVPRRIKKKWRNEEVVALLDGILKYGIGKWAFITKDPQFGFYLTNRSCVDLKDKWRNLGVIVDESNIKDVVSALRLEFMHTPPLTSKKQSKKSKKRTKKEVVAEHVSDCESYHSQPTITPQRKRNRCKSVHRTRNLNSEKVHDKLTHQSPLSSENVIIEELSDSKDYHISCTINQSKKSNSEKNRDNFPPESSFSVEEITQISNKELDEDVSDSGDYIPCTITRQRRGTRCNTNQDKKLDSNKVHSYLENLWRGIPEEKQSSFAHLDPLWYILYSKDSNKERVLNWIKKKDVFSRKYVVFPIVQWGHWNVVIFCHFGETIGSKFKSPCILLLDSLEKTDHSKQLEPIIRKFVLDIYKKLEMTEDIKKLRQIPFLVPKVPQQRDDEECGFCVLYYIKLFVENAPESFSSSDGYPYFMKKDWFNFEELDSFCKTLHLSPK